MNHATKSALPCAGLVVLLALAGCSSGAGAGETCRSQGDCASNLQCFAGVCTPQCEIDIECGDGHVCTDNRCELVVSDIGDACARELDCGPGQTCLLSQSDDDGNGVIEGTCAGQLSGAAVGAPCVTDTNCASGSCNLSRCTSLCQSSIECGPALTCTLLPRDVQQGHALFSGCFQEGGTLELPIPVSSSHSLTRVLVPGNARSIAITAKATDRTLVPAVTFLQTPAGTVWYRAPQTLEDFINNPIRYAPAKRESTLIAPNRPTLSLVPGAYAMRVGTNFANGEAAQEVPTVRVVYKLHDRATLDVNVYILNLADHPCEEMIGNAPLSAATADDHTGIDAFLDRLGEIFAAAEVELGTVRYHDVGRRPDLDALDISDLDKLLPLASGEPGLNLFLVRSLSPGGIQVIGGGNPAAPRLEGSLTSGVALSMDTLCYRDWRTASRLVAHAFGRQMGLFRNREPNSAIVDPISDSSTDVDNLMFFGEFGGTDISPGQATVLRHYPGLR